MALSPQGANTPVAGAFLQPSPGITAAAVEPYRDSQITTQVASQASAPGAGATVATVTPAVAGIYEVSGTVSISGTTVAAAESNNMQLKQGSTEKLTNIPIAVNGTSGAPGAAPFGPVLLSLDGATAVTVVAVGASTASSIYAAQIVCRLVG